jgi:HB1, ASXL, restriction endonuclease HTH domain
MTAKKTTAKKTTTKAKATKPVAKKATKPKADAKPKKLSALDAAAKVLAENKEPLNTRQMIEAMAKKGLWTSPGGATPWATLYSALSREITAKGKDARFKKVERGQFAFNG